MDERKEERAHDCSATMQTALTRTVKHDQKKHAQAQSTRNNPMDGPLHNEPCGDMRAANFHRASQVEAHAASVCTQTPWIRGMVCGSSHGSGSTSGDAVCRVHLANFTCHGEWIMWAHTFVAAAEPTSAHNELADMVFDIEASNMEQHNAWDGAPTSMADT